MAFGPVTGVTPHFFTCDERHMCVTNITPFCMAVTACCSLHHFHSSSSFQPPRFTLNHPILPPFQPPYFATQSTTYFPSSPSYFTHSLPHFSSINRALSFTFYTPTLENTPTHSQEPSPISSPNPHLSAIPFCQATRKEACHTSPSHTTPIYLTVSPLSLFCHFFFNMLL